MCNAFSLSTLLIHDRLHGTDFRAGRVDQMAQAFREHRYLRPDNRFMAARGPLKFAMGPSVGNDGVMSYWLNFAMPEQAGKTWDNLRRNYIHVTDDDVKIDATAWRRWTGQLLRRDRSEPGLGDGRSQEHGDDELADAMEKIPGQALQGGASQRCAGLHRNLQLGQRRPRLGQVHHRGSMADLLAGRVPEPWRTGPVLAQAAYPDVLVSRAVTDGRALDLVLRPGNGGSRTVLAIEQLAPGHEYVMAGAVEETVTADEAGRGWWPSTSAAVARSCCGRPTRRSVAGMSEAARCRCVPRPFRRAPTAAPGAPSIRIGRRLRTSGPHPGDRRAGGAAVHLASRAGRRVPAPPVGDSEPFRGHRASPRRPRPPSARSGPAPGAGTAAVLGAALLGIRRSPLPRSPGPGWTIVGGRCCCWRPRPRSPRCHWPCDGACR